MQNENLLSLLKQHYEVSRFMRQTYIVSTFVCLREEREKIEAQIEKVILATTLAEGKMQ